MSGDRPALRIALTQVVQVNARRNVKKSTTLSPHVPNIILELLTYREVLQATLRDLTRVVWFRLRICSETLTSLQEIKSEWTVNRYRVGP